MSEVYLRWEGDYEDRYVAEIYDSLEGVQSAHPTDHEPQWREWTPGSWDCQWRIEAIPPEPWTHTFETLRHPVIDGKATLRDGDVVTVTGGFKYVDEPVLPEGFRLSMGTPAKTCAFNFERMEVLANLRKEA